MGRGVRDDRKMLRGLKAKIHSTVVRPALMYGAEMWVCTVVREGRVGEKQNENDEIGSEYVNLGKD